MDRSLPLEIPMFGHFQLTNDPIETSVLDDELRIWLKEPCMAAVEHLGVLTGRTFPTWSI